ncbi:MAG: 50S ribosomal protein L11 methyltransferase [Chloroflexota bacterium]
MYDLFRYGMMMQDKVRVNAHYQALKQVIRPGSVVIDLGAGTGILSVMACKLGAKRVYAIESNLWGALGKQIAAANGVADQIEFIHGKSTEVTLPERGDIVIGDLRGTTPISFGNLHSLNDARERLLKPDGILIPRRDVVYVTLVNIPDIYEAIVTQPWLHNSYGINMEAGHKYAINTPHNNNLRDIQPLLPPTVWAEINYDRPENFNWNAVLEWTASEAATAHAVFAWFHAQLTDDVGYTTAPWEDIHARVYGNFMLSFERPLEIAPEDTVKLELQAALIQESYVYVWNTTVRSKNGEVKSSFQQNSFFGKPPALEAFSQHKLSR